MTKFPSPQYADVPYAGNSPAQKLDLYLPSGRGGPFPLVVAVHGGAFAFGDKADPGWLPPFLQALGRGYAVAAVNYRLSPEAKFPAQVHDVKAAVRHLRANAETYRIDPKAIAAWGDSAGGNLVSLAAASSVVRTLEDLSMGNGDTSSLVQAVVDWYGPIDFLDMDEQIRQSGIGEPTHDLDDSPESVYLGKPLTSDPELARRASPATYITGDTPPFFIQHGTLDGIIPVQQSIRFAAMLERAIGADNVKLSLLEGAGHGGPAFEAEENVARVLEFLDSRLKN